MVPDSSCRALVVVRNGDDGPRLLAGAYLKFPYHGHRHKPHLTFLATPDCAKSPERGPPPDRCHPPRFSRAGRSGSARQRGGWSASAYGEFAGGIGNSADGSFPQTEHLPLLWAENMSFLPASRQQTRLFCPRRAHAYFSSLTFKSCAAVLVPPVVGSLPLPPRRRNAGNVMAQFSIPSKSIK